MTETFANKLIFVDDDRFYNRRWIRELEATFDVAYYDEPNEAVAVLLEQSERIVLILDLMMQVPCDELDAETEGGTLTGLWILRQCVPVLRATKSPVIVLSYQDSTFIRNQLERQNIDDVVHRVYAKRSARPGQLVAWAKEAARQNEIPRGQVTDK